MTKVVPLLVASLLGLLLLPWHLILPERQPYRSTFRTPPTVAKYRDYLAKSGQKDDRADYFIIEELGRDSAYKGRTEAMWKEDPELMREYANIVWANRERSYFIRLLQNLYGTSAQTLLWSRVWIVPAILLFVYAVIYALMLLFGAKARVASG